MSFQGVPQPAATDPDSAYLASSCLDFLLIELVPLAFRVTNDLEPELSAPASAAATSLTAAGPGLLSPTAAASSSAATGEAGGPSVAPGTMAGGRKMDEDEEKDAVFYRLEALGYRVGQGLVER